MGFNVTALAQKARTKTIIVDSDLDMGQYDVIATDVKGDTAEFSEFVGGVGNFTSGLFSGGVDVSGILHAEGNTQVDGNIILEGSINNVNIADDGEITTTKGVNGADFNGATITATKFNGATIDSTGNVTGAKGTFSGAVTGTSFNGLQMGCKVILESTSGKHPAFYTGGQTNSPCRFVSFDVPYNVKMTNEAIFLNRGFSSAGYPRITEIVNNSGQQLVLSVPTGCTFKCGNTTYSAGETNITTATANTIIKTVGYVNGTSGAQYSSYICIQNKWSSGVGMYASFQ